MQINAFSILVILALIFTVLSMVSPRFPLLAIAVLLISIALLLAKGG
jgi:hypothetical protein